MEHYTLQDQETVLYKGYVTVKNSEDKISLKNTSAQVILTNLNFVLIIKRKWLFGENVDTYVHDVKDVKIYDSSPQVIRNKKNVEIYMTSGERFIEFPTEKGAREFTDKALKLVSGYSKLVRGVKKVQKAVEETDEALGINIVAGVKDAAVLAGEIAIEASAAGSVGRLAKVGSTVARVLFNHKKNTPKLASKNEDKSEMEYARK